jgi:hypothetical protein
VLSCRPPWGAKPPAHITPRSSSRGPPPPKSSWRLRDLYSLPPKLGVLSRATADAPSTNLSLRAREKSVADAPTWVHHSVVREETARDEPARSRQMLTYELARLATVPEEAMAKWGHGW